MITKERVNKKVSDKEKAHIVYKNKEGGKVPGTTTILGVLAKNALIHWAWDLGTKGIDYRKFRDEKATIGTLAHYLIQCHLSGEEPQTDDYSKNQIEQAENCTLSYYEWEKNHPIKPILLEEPLVSELYQYGGTIDIYAELNGKNVLIDLKTSKAIYANPMAYQLAAYRELLVEKGQKVDYAMILNIPRDENEEFKTQTWLDLTKETEIFFNCLSIYNLQKK
jgi:hypothetical protein